MKERDQNKKPDWKNPKDYESMNKLGPNQWAWEFLRRNPEYIKDWGNFKEENFIDDDGHLKKGCLTLSFKWGVVSGSMLFPDPHQTYADRNNDPDGISFFPTGGVETVLLGKTDESMEHLFLGLPNFQTGQQSFQFNFLEPISPQIERVKERLLMLQKRAKEMGITRKSAFKPRRDEWILLIRILDATAAGATDKEIAAILFSDEKSLDPYAGIKKVYDKRMQALRYVNQDYRHIPYSDK